MKNIYDLFSLKQLIEDPTRVTMGTSIITDHIATTHPQNILKSGVQKISSKQAIPYIESSLAFIVNTSIETCVFPDMWKTVGIRPISKDDDKTDKSIYCPISVFPVLSRIFERLVYNQLYKYFEENCFLSANQSGFRAWHSTATCLLNNCEDWYDAMDNG